MEDDEGEDRSYFFPADVSKYLIDLPEPAQNDWDSQRGAFMVSGAPATTPAESEQEAGRRTVMRAMWVGLWVWPAFTVLDALDFGAARLRDHATSTDRLTWTGILISTPSYLAPELWQGAPADERSDIYALGATLHFLLSGATPSTSHGRDSARDVGPGARTRATT